MITFSRCTKAFPLLLTAVISLAISRPFLAGASDFRSPRTDALGGAGHASPLLSDTIYLNPSFTSFSPVHGASFNYLNYRGDAFETPVGVSDYYGRNMNVSILDGSADALFQAGAGYTRRDDVNMIHVGASKSYLKRIGVGVGAKFVFPRNGSEPSFNDTSVSVSGIIERWVQAALIIDNILNNGKSQGFVREVILGTKFSLNNVLSIYIDPHFTGDLDRKWGFEAGAEFPFFSDLFFRIGKFQSATVPFISQRVANQRGDGYGAGVGWLAPKLALEYGYSRVLAPLSAYSHQFGVTIYF